MDRPSDLDRPDTESADEATADAARRRLREQGIIALEPDPRIGVMLAREELVVSVRRGVSVERRKDTRDPSQALSGDLYVTTTRLVCLGHVPIEIRLARIREAVVAAGALRLVVGDGQGLEIRTSDPCVLRVEIAAVREAARARAGGSGLVERSRDIDPSSDGR